MDPKGDDSGSDTLDQSLQKKCVVADDDSSSKQPDAAVREDNAAEEPTTEPGGNMSDPKDSPASPSPPPPLSQQSPLSPTADNNTSDDAVSLVAVKDKDLPDENTSSSGGKDDSRGFESKVRQISDDLKDTTLADENSLEKVEDREEETEAAAAAVSASATALGGDIKNDSDGYDSDRTITYESPSKKSSSSSSEKKRSKKTTKKVRFKYHLGKVVCSDDEGDDEGDEDDDDEDDDTLNEGGRCKKLRIPLSFASPHDEDDLSDEAQGLADEAEEEDPPPEGGIKNILGKLSKMGKIEYLFRWEDKEGLWWETEEVLSKMCPNLIRLYEEKRAKEREQDMHYLMRRKKIRQDLRNV